MKSIKNTKKIQAKRKKKTRKNQNNKRKTKKECCKFGSGRTRRKRKRNQKTCSICLEQIPRSQLITTGCNHHFHSNCLKIWCDTNELENEVTCPYCKTTFLISEQFLKVLKSWYIQLQKLEQL